MNNSAGNVRKLPPPATELMSPCEKCGDCQESRLSEVHAKEYLAAHTKKVTRFRILDFDTTWFRSQLRWAFRNTFVMI